MISDLDIYRAAKLLIDQHGENAPIRAAEQADELLEPGDLGVWVDVAGDPEKGWRSCGAGVDPREMVN